MSRPANAFYIGVRYESGTIISKPLTHANPYTTSATAVLRAYLEGRLDMIIEGHSTVVVTDEGGTIRGSKGEGRYVSAVLQAIRSAFFRNGVSVMHTDTITPPSNATTQPVPSAAPASSPSPTPSFYASTSTFPKYNLVIS